MFLTCHVDLPVATTMKSAQSHCLSTGITVISSALTSFRTYSISCRFSNSFLLESGLDDENCWFEAENPSFHNWLAREDDGDNADEEKYGGRDRTAAHMSSRHSEAATSHTLLLLLRSGELQKTLKRRRLSACTYSTQLLSNGVV